MPTPKFRTSKSKRNMRRSHHALKVPPMSRCPETGEVKAPHCVSPNGKYKGELVNAKMAAKANALGGLSDLDLEN
jgi:large subunit ribosomal protein L32